MAERCCECGQLLDEQFSLCEDCWVRRDDDHGGECDCDLCIGERARAASRERRADVEHWVAMRPLRDDINW